MDDPLKENIYGVMILFSTEYDLHLHKIGEEKKQYLRLLKNGIENNSSTSLSEEIDIAPNKRLANLTARDEYRKNTSPDGHGGAKKKIFNSLVRNLAYYLKTPSGHIDWPAVLIILIDTPALLLPIFPHRKIIFQEYFKPYINRDYDGTKATLSTKEALGFEKFRLKNDYIKLTSYYLYTDTYHKIIKSLQRAIR